MPALVAFNRRWRIGSDDLVFPAAVGLIIRFLWLIGLSSIYGYFQRDTRKCNASLELELFFIGAITVTSLVIVNEVAIMYVSMLGTVMEARPRRHMPILLYIQVFLYLPEASWTILGTYWVVNKSVNCELGVTIAVWVSVVLQWSILLAVLIGVMLLFDPLGTLHNHDEEGGVGDGMLKESTKKLWEKRCRLLCCCFAGRDDQYLSAISDIADILACQLHDVDVVPSDVAVGLILLQEEQEREEGQKRANGELTKKGQPVNFNDAKEQSLVEDAVHFMKFALGSYGWPLYVFMNPCTGPCNLCMGIRCCQCCRAGPEHILGDNCCLCNSAGLKLQTDLEDIHVVFFSYQNKIYEVPFYVAVDHSRKSIVVSVRGSLSMQDALTDLTGQCEELTIEGIENSFAHKGILRCASYVKSVLEERQLLETAFSQAAEDYRLVVVGHSLGAGTASLLSVLLKPRYPNLLCFAYSNPSVLSASTTPYCEDFIVSVIFGKDAIPRLGVNRLNELRHELVSVIRRCCVSKYRVLMTGCWKALCFLLGPRPRDGEGEARVHFFSRFRPYRCTNIDLSWENSMTQPLLADVPDETSGLTGRQPSVRYLDDKELEPIPESQLSLAEQLYPAGKILQIDERPCIRISRPRYDVMWADKENYTRLIIHPRMLSDHMPDHVMKALNGILVKEPQVHEV